MHTGSRGVARCAGTPLNHQQPKPKLNAGGSNFGGLAFPILREKMAGRMSPRVIAVEPAACPSLTKGKYVYDYGDTAGEPAAAAGRHPGLRLFLPMLPGTAGFAAGFADPPAREQRLRAEVGFGNACLTHTHRHIHTHNQTHMCTHTPAIDLFQASPRWSRCTRWATPLCRTPSTPAACATTAWRRW